MNVKHLINSDEMYFPLTKIVNGVCIFVKVNVIDLLFFVMCVCVYVCVGGRGL